MRQPIKNISLARQYNAPADKKHIACPAIPKRRKVAVSATFRVTSPCQRLARGLGSGLKPLLMKKGLGLMEVLQAFACNGVWGYPPARGNTSLYVCYGTPQQGNALHKNLIRNINYSPKISPIFIWRTSII